ncbi:MAG: hypothetical protein SFX19_09615 [Alphaproteobacteria bacterium]|nr:hypothetical protein [Alphaproteobacteria bacterium]
MRHFVVALVWGMVCMGQAAHADPIDEITQAIFEGDPPAIKAEYRRCTGDSDCTAVLSLCRWRPVNKSSEKHVSEVSNTVKLECKWPPPPATPPVARCMDRLCDIRPDGKYY